MVVLMARVLTYGLGVVARAAPCPPRVLDLPLALRSHSVATVVDEVVLMARCVTFLAGAECYEST